MRARALFARVRVAAETRKSASAHARFVRVAVNHSLRGRQRPTQNFLFLFAERAIVGCQRRPPRG